jgi:hypothetical protein
MEMWHGKRGIQISSGLVVLYGAFLVTCVLSAQGHQVVSTSVQFIKIQYVLADLFRFSQITTVGKKGGDK